MSRTRKSSTVKESKNTGRSTRVLKEDKDEKLDVNECTVNFNDKTEKHLIDVDVSDNEDKNDCDEQPTVTNWASDTTVAPTLTKKDIVKLDQEDAEKLNKQTVENTSINDLLRVLIKRGYDNSNPALAKGSERLLLQLNCISTAPYRDEPREKRRFAGPPGGHGTRGRGNFNNTRNERFDRPERSQRDEYNDRNNVPNRFNNQESYTTRNYRNNGYRNNYDQGNRDKRYNNSYDDFNKYSGDQDSSFNQVDNSSPKNMKQFGKRMVNPNNSSSYSNKSNNGLDENNQ